MSCMECLYAHIPSHSPSPSHMPMPSVITVTGSTNDIHITSPYRLTSTQCKCQWATNLESIPTLITQLKVYVITVCLILGNITFRITLRVSYAHVPVINMTVCLLWVTELFGSHHRFLTPMFQAFHLRGLTTPAQHTLIIFHFML